MRDPGEQARSFWLPEQAFGHLKRRRRTVSEYSGDVLRPLATVGVEAGGQHVDPGERPTVAGEHDGRVEPGKARQAVQVLDQAYSSIAVARHAGTQTRDWDDTGQQVVSAEQGSFFGVPKGQVAGRMTRRDDALQLSAAGRQRRTILDADDLARCWPRRSSGECRGPEEIGQPQPWHAKSDQQVSEGLGVGGTDQASHLRQTAHDATTRTTNDRRGGTEVVRMSMGDDDLFDIAQPTTVGAQQTLELLQ